MRTSTGIHALGQSDLTQRYLVRLGLCCRGTGDADEMQCGIGDHLIQSWSAGGEWPALGIRDGVRVKIRALTNHVGLRPSIDAKAAVQDQHATS